MRHRFFRSCSASSLAWALLGCGGGFDLETALDPVVRAHDDNEPFAWDPSDYAARPSAPPERARAWSWPSTEAFHARWREREYDTLSPGIAVGRHGWHSLDGSVFDGRRSTVGVIQPPGATWPAFIDLRPHFCRGPFPAWPDEISAGDPFQPGRVEIGRSHSTRFFDVEYAFAPRRLVDEDLRDWVYATTLMDDARELAAANSESARGEWQCGSDDSPCWERVERDERRRRAELAVACWESGLAGCYLAGRLEVILPTVGSEFLHDMPVIAPDVLARGPVDLRRFFVGLLLDETHIDNPALPRPCWCFDLASRIALAIFDFGQARVLEEELWRRITDRKRDIWTRVRMLSTLTALLNIDRKGAEHRGIFNASSNCALLVLTGPDPNIDDVYELCVERPERALHRLDEGGVGSEASRLFSELFVGPP